MDPGQIQSRPLKWLDHVAGQRKTQEKHALTVDDEIDRCSFDGGWVEGGSAVISMMGSRMGCSLGCKE